MSNGNGHKKSVSWFRWIVGVIVSVLAAGGGIVAILQYQDSRAAEAQARYQREIEIWRNFSPKSLSIGVQRVEFRPLDRFDLESGHVTGVPERQWDLLFGCWPQGRESLRASVGVSWSDRGVANFEKVRYREIRDARFVAPKHQRTGYLDLYYAHRSNTPRDGYIFFIKTTEGNVAKIQITGYRVVDPNPKVCRNVKLQYEVFPVVGDPPKPRR